MQRLTRTLAFTGTQLIPVLAGLITLPALAFGQEEPLAAPAPLPAIDGGSTAWMLTATALVLMMTLPGLALFYGGLVRTRNVLSIMMQCFAIAGLSSLLWLVAGYSLAFTDGGAANGFTGGLSRAMLAGMGKTAASGQIPEALFVLFQMTFAIITPALIIGAYAERIRFSAVIWFSTLWLMVVYVPVAHWVWGGGWLAQMGFLDYAGGAVVHITAGVASLVAALYIGPRSGFPHKAMMPHNMTMAVTGAGMLWVGWFGFNGGSALAANGDAAMAMLATHIAAAAGAMAWMFLEWARFSKPTVLGVVTGMVAGLGTITPASGYVGPGGALAIGLIAGAVCFNAVIVVKRVLKIDDSLDVFPVHGVGGVIGTLMAGFFSAPFLGVFSGFGFGPGNTTLGQQLGVQAIGVAATALYTALLTWLLLLLVNKLVTVRVSKDTETEGLDVVQHEERGYDL